MICLFFLISAPALAILLIVGFLKKKKVKDLLRNSRQTEGIITEIEYKSGADTDPRFKTITYAYQDTLQVSYQRSFRWQGKTAGKGDTIQVYYNEQNHAISKTDIEVSYWNSFIRRCIPAYLIFVGLCIGIYLAALIARNYS